MAHNFKYHTLDDLERLIVNLQKEVASTKIWADHTTMAAPEMIGRTTRQLVEAEEMLREAEYEVLERTLLGGS